MGCHTVNGQERHTWSFMKTAVYLLYSKLLFSNFTKFAWLIVPLNLKF